MDTGMSDEVVNNATNIETENRFELDSEKNMENPEPNSAIDSSKKPTINTENEAEEETNQTQNSNTKAKPPVTPTISNSTPSNANCLTDPLNLINNINSLKRAICELPLDPCEQKYIEINITPMLNIADELSRISSNLANSVALLSTSVIVCPNRCEIEQTINFIYELNRKCEEVYCNVNKKINNLLC